MAGAASWVYKKILKKIGTIVIKSDREARGWGNGMVRLSKSSVGDDEQKAVAEIMSVGLLGMGPTVVSLRRRLQEQWLWRSPSALR